MNKFLFKRAILIIINCKISESCNQAPIGKKWKESLDYMTSYQLSSVDIL